MPSVRAAAARVKCLRNYIVCWSRIRHGELRSAELGFTPCICWRAACSFSRHRARRASSVGVWNRGRSPAVRTGATGLHNCVPRRAVLRSCSTASERRATSVASAAALTPGRCSMLGQERSCSGRSRHLRWPHSAWPLRRSRRPRVLSVFAAVSDRITDRMQTIGACGERTELVVGCCPLRWSDLRPHDGARRASAWPRQG